MSAGATTRIAIANRGEIAARIAATCRERGLEPVLVCGEPDRDSYAARAIGRVEVAGPAGSELDPDLVVAAARRAGATLLHPGYGFLSERPSLARACRQAGITFVGPAAETLEVSGDKVATRAVAAATGVPVLEASELGGDDPSDWQAAAQRVGYPLLVKAAGGGGGASLRRVDSPEELAEAVASSRREAEVSGAGGVLYLERFLEAARHIEVQVAGDGTRAIALGERECSLQRRHQKVIEEAPAANLPEEDRQRLFRYAVAVAEAVQLTNLATVEFLYGADGTIAFIEVNPRLQVEHPVTELVTGLDLVGLQLDLALGGELPNPPAVRGHAVEARLYAEDPAQHFLPSPGPLEVFALPRLPGVRVDPAYAAGDRVPDRYDPLLAKLIGFGVTRASALERLRDGLRRCTVAGVAMNRTWLLALLEDERVRAGRYDTATAGAVPAAQAEAPDRLGIAGLAAAMLERPPSIDPWESLGPFRLGGTAELAFSGRGRPGTSWERVIAVAKASDGWRLRDDEGEEPFEWWRELDGAWTVRLGDAVERLALARHPDGTLELATPRGRWLAEPGRAPQQRADGSRQAEGRVRAPLPGKVLRIEVAPEQAVRDGQPLVILSAMKIEVVLRAPFDGRVTAVDCAVGEQVEAGAVLVELGPDVTPAPA